MNAVAKNLVFDPQIIRRFDINGPRYTSYPTADRFVEAFGADAYELWLGKRNIGAVSRQLSLYFHIPFCNTICYYCACNKIITKDHGRSAKYLKYLARELALQSSHLEGGDHEVAQLHWGGGTPTFLSHDEMRQLMAATRQHFELIEGGEYSIEVDPRKVNAATVELLAELGFNRMSVGVQDFDPAVQQAVNRIQSEDETRAVIGAARASGFKSISVDLIYGLPKQTLIGFGRALGDEQRVQAGTGFVTITATIEPENITSAISSDEFKLMTGLWGVGENNEVPILISFDQEMAFNVQALEEVSYQSNSSVTNTLDRLGILDVSPPVGSVLNGRTTFTITVFYELTSMDTANLNTTLLPAFGGAAVLGNDQQIIERGSGELTYSFEFEPLEPDEPSTWMLDLRLESPQANPDEAALAAVSPHVDFPNDVYRFEP